ncbi:hypothetical protein niasHT_015883 [Heterodera trifolii]|uniref:alanine--tRNA ligase n=1 Tax=Heterodera trifolii TaxID=157864 RepID=A0ABD2LJY8_9BILA
MLLLSMSGRNPVLLVRTFKIRPFFSSYGFSSKEIRKMVPTRGMNVDFIYAGIQQFTDIIKNEKKPFAPRVVNSQKCLRLGGSHIKDIELVGKDAYHHSFFEMLGNWSFGDYFKAEACAWAWEFLVHKLNIPPECLYVSYFGGNSANGLASDEESRKNWLDIGVPAERILPFGMKDNFWEMGGTGPCGPCSEIHYDRVGGRNAAHLVNTDDPMVVEIWNLVFIQYYREENAKLRPLSSKYVDCGMGLERLVSVVQQKVSNYDTDLFTPIFDVIQKCTTQKHKYQGRFGDSDKESIDVAYRIVSDHMRAVTVALADGIGFTNQQQKKSSRKIKELFKRATIYGSQMLGMERMSMYLMVPIIVEQLGETFPEMAQNKHKIADAVRIEEERLWKQRDDGMRHLEELFRNHPPTSKVFPGKFAFIIVQNYRIELELVKRKAAQRGLTVDEAEYQRLHAQKTMGSGLKIKEQKLKYGDITQ